MISYQCPKRRDWAIRLDGAGRTELALSVFGNPRGYKIMESSILTDSRFLSAIQAKALEAGICYVTEDRKGEGLILITGY